MMGQLEILVTLATVLLLLAAAWFSYVIYKFNRLGSGWFAVTAAFYFMAAHGVLNFAVQTGAVENTPFLSYLREPWLPLITSILVCYGVYAMTKSFESFEVVESKTHAKIEAFNKRK